MYIGEREWGREGERLREIEIMEKLLLQISIDTKFKNIFVQFSFLVSDQLENLLWRLQTRCSTSI
jgi:hypothetical protein